MASQVSIAIERDAAIERINAALEGLSDDAGVPYDGIPVQGRDQSIVNKNQLVFIADTLEALLVKDAPSADATLEDGDRDTEDALVETPSDVEAQVAVLRPTSKKKG
jgi:hypothetical protein